MKALVYQDRERLEYRDVEFPTAGDGEVIVRIDSVGICGSDMHAYLGRDGRRPPPLILGHEAAGVVCGGDHGGRRVAVNPLISCGKCDACAVGRENLCPQRQVVSIPPRAGAFAQYLSIPEGNTVEVPNSVSLETASLVEPLACAWHAVRRAVQAKHGFGSVPKALVLGGGAIGLGAVLCLRHRGIEDVTIVEPNPVRRAFLEKCCGLCVVEMNGLQGEVLFGIVVDAVGIEASRRMACLRVKPGGLIVHIGLGSAKGGLDARRMTLQEITFIGAYTFSATDFRDTASAMFSGKLGPLDWFETRSLQEGGRAFRDLGLGKVAAPKIILKPS